jgi:hypothetical protein
MISRPARTYASEPIVKDWYWPCKDLQVIHPVILGSYHVSPFIYIVYCRSCSVCIKYAIGGVSILLAKLKKQLTYPQIRYTISTKEEYMMISNFSNRGVY